jgi:hypothetical protein
LHRRIFIIVFAFLFATSLCEAGVETVSPDGATWVASTWGYNTPKLLFDGKKVYALGLAGTDLDHCVARLFWRDESGWHRGADLTPVYQPATILLDSKGYIYLFTTARASRGYCWRSKEPGEVDQFEQVPLTEPEKFAYGYLGAAIDGDRVMLAGLDPQYNMWLTVRESADAKWDAPMLIASGQKDHVPWDSAVYPMLLPDADGVDVVYSNSPDGGVHNTYNRVEISRIDWKSRKVIAHETIAQGPVGEDTYGLDALKLKDGTIHVLYFAGLHVYGDVAPDIDQRRGLFCATRLPSGQWKSVRVTTDTGTSQFFHDPKSDRLWVLQTDTIGAAGFYSDDRGEHWKAASSPIFSAPGQFLHILKPTSGSLCDDRLRALQSTTSHALQYIELTLPAK